MIEDLLTAREVQDLLKLDRTTVYRMLKDGRLAGVKVGQQWRFRRREVEALLDGGAPLPQTPEPPPTPEFPPHDRPAALSPLPLHCVQAIQDVFADLTRVGAVTTAPDGRPLTEISNGCRFCALLQASEGGRAACQASWRALAQRTERQPQIAACHAGLNYVHARIEVGGAAAAMLIAGQFRLDDTPIDVQRLARDYGIDAGALAMALDDITIIDARTRKQLGAWLQKVARTFEQIGGERAAMMSRLRAISHLAGADLALDPA